MDTMKYGKIGEANSRAEADVIKSFLEAEGINVELIEESYEHSAYTTAVGRIQIFIPKESLERARELLVSFGDVIQKDDEEEE
jgi:hypothetical protein